MAAEESLTSGPAKDTPLGKLSCYAHSGPHAGKEFDVAETVGSAPAAILFIHDLSRNTAPVIRELDRLGEEHGLLGFKSYSVMLNNDRTEGENMLKRVNGSLKLHQPIVLSLDGLDGPGDYALNRRCTLTLILAKKGKIHDSIALTDTGPGDFPKLKTWVESVAGKVPEDEAELKKLLASNLPEDAESLKDLAVNQKLLIRKLRQDLVKARQQRGGRAMNRRGMQERQRRNEQAKDANGESSNQEGDKPPRKREGKPPEDPELNSLLRSFIRKTNDNERADEVFASIKTRAEESDELKTETVEMFRLMLSFRDRYGTEYAQGLAESFLKEHGPKPAEP